MPITPPFRGRKTAEAWTWEPGEKERFRRHLNGLGVGKWEIHAAKRPTRSQRANAYYWSTVLLLIAQHTEHTPEEIHDAMCARFLPNEHKRVEFFNRHTGEQLDVDIDTRRSSKLTGAPFYDFVEQVRMWAADWLGVFTPDPDPEYWRKGHADAGR